MNTVTAVQKQPADLVTNNLLFYKLPTELINRIVGIVAQEDIKAFVAFLSTCSTAFQFSHHVMQKKDKLENASLDFKIFKRILEFQHCNQQFQSVQKLNLSKLESLLQVEEVLRIFKDLQHLTLPQNVLREEIVSENQLLVFAQSCQKLESLNLVGCTYLADARILAIFQAASSLKALDLSHSTLTNEEMITFSSEWKCLDTLTLCGCRIHSLPLGLVLQNCPKLQFLNIAFSPVDEEVIGNALKGIAPRNLEVTLSYDSHFFPGELRKIRH